MPDDHIKTPPVATLNQTRQGKPTLRTVSELTGFAVTTVSRALADDPRIAESTRKTVRDAAEQIGYTPDRAAQRLRTGRTKVIALLVNTEHEFLGFTHELVAGISEPLQGTGYNVIVSREDIEGDRLAAVRKIVQTRSADGLIISRTELFDPRVRYLLENDFPFVSHGQTEFTAPHPYVDYDNEAYARDAVRRLIQKGRKHLAIVLPDARYTFSQHLRYGFLAAARDAGVTHEILEGITLEVSPEDMVAAIEERLSAPNPPDGFVCVGEVVALATLSALYDRGIQPGEDVDVVAKRASPIFRLMRPRIETVFEDVRETGRCIGAALLKRMEGVPSTELQTIISPGEDWR